MISKFVCMLSQRLFQGSGRMNDLPDVAITSIGWRIELTRNCESGFSDAAVQAFDDQETYFNNLDYQREELENFMFHFWHKIAPFDSREFDIC